MSKREIERNLLESAPVPQRLQATIELQVQTTQLAMQVQALNRQCASTLEQAIRQRELVESEFSDLAVQIGTIVAMLESLDQRVLGMETRLSRVLQCLPEATQTTSGRLVQPKLSTERQMRAALEVLKEMAAQQPRGR